MSNEPMEVPEPTRHLPLLTFQYTMKDMDPKGDFYIRGKVKARCLYTACMEALSRQTDVTEVHHWGPTNIMIQVKQEQRGYVFSVTFTNVDNANISGVYEVVIERIV